MPINRILKYFIYAATLLPLIIFSQYISPFHFGKVVVFRSMIEIMFALYLILVWKDRSFLPRRDNFFWTFLAFTLAYTITTFTSVNVYQSFWGTLERMGGAYSFWHYFIFYIILTSVLRTSEDWHTFLKITIGVGVLSAFYGFGQRTHLSLFIGGDGRDRIFGTIGNAALYAGYQILGAFLALILGLNTSNKTERNFFLVSAFLMGVAAFMTAVRGSLLGISIGLVVFAFLYFSQTNSKLARKALFSLLAIGVIFIGFAFLFKDNSIIKDSPYLRRITNFSISNYTVQTRFWAWKAGLRGWSENPEKIIFGWGPENFNIPFSKYFDPRFFTGPGSETLFDRAHNMFVEILVTTGLIGFIAYLYLFATIFRMMWRLKNKPEFRIPAIGFIALTIAYIIHNSFIFDTSANFVAFFSILGFMSYLNHTASEQTVKVSTPIRATYSGPEIFGAVLVCLIALFFVYQTNIKTAEANYATTRGIVAGWDNDFNAAFDDYKEALSYDVAGRYEYRNRFAQFLLDYSGTTTDLASANVQSAFQLAIQVEEENAAQNPFDYLPELYLSRLNIILGKSDPKSLYNDVALEHAKKALTYSETFVRTYYEIGQGYLNKKDYVNATAQFQKAVDLNPTVGTSYWYLGALEMQDGQVDKALSDMSQAIKLGYVLNENDYLNLASSYVKRNDFEHLVPIYEGLVKLKPTDAQYMASLAVAYAKVGRIDDAVAEARLTVQTDPNFLSEAQKFVESLGRTW